MGKCVLIPSEHLEERDLVGKLCGRRNALVPSTETEEMPGRWHSTRESVVLRDSKGHLDDSF